MTTLQGGNKALLVIDPQNVILRDAFRRDETVSKISEVIDKARNSSVPVIWVQHSDADIVVGSEDWKFVAELHPDPKEMRVDKHFRSAFVETRLHEILQSLEVSHVVICGAESNNCVRHTSHSALELGYDVTLVRDAHTTTSFEWDGLVVDAARVVDEQNTNLMNYQLPGRTAQVIAAADLVL